MNADHLVVPYHGSRLLSFLVACYHFSEYLGHLPWLGGSCKRYLRWITDYTPSLGRTIITTYKHTTRITSERTREHLKIFPFLSFPFLFFFFHAIRRVLSLLGKQGKDKKKERKRNLGIWDQTEGRRERKSNYVKSEHARERERESDGGERRERRAILSERLCPRTRFSNRSNLQSANRRRRQPSNKSNSRRNGEGGSGEEKREAAAAALRGE